MKTLKKVLLPIAVVALFSSGTLLPVTAYVTYLPAKGGDGNPISVSAKYTKLADPLGIFPRKKTYQINPREVIKIPANKIKWMKVRGRFESKNVSRVVSKFPDARLEGLCKKFKRLHKNAECWGDKFYNALGNTRVENGELKINEGVGLHNLQSIELVITRGPKGNFIVSEVRRKFFDYLKNEAVLPAW